MKGLTTTRLFSLIKQSRNMNDMQKNIEDGLMNPDASAYLKNLLDKSGLTPPEVAKEVFLDRSYTYQLFNGIRHPNRNILLRFSFAFHLNLDETQRLLKLHQKGELYPRILRDAVIIYSIEKKYELIDANELIVSIGEAPLFSEEI